MKAWFKTITPDQVLAGVWALAVLTLVLLVWHGCNNMLRSSCLKEHHPPSVCAELP